MEVLLAMVIVGLAIAATSELFSQSLHLASRAGEYTIISFLADSKLNEAPVLLAGDETSLSGTFDGYYGRYSWRLEKSGLDGAASNGYTGFDDDELIKAAPGLYGLTITITWTERDRERSFTLTSYQSALIKKEEV